MVFNGPAPSVTRPEASGRRFARPPPPAVLDLDRAPPPPQHPARGAPPPPSAPAQPGCACVGGGGASGHSPHYSSMASVRRKTQVLNLGAYNSKNKFRRVLIFAPKGVPFIFRQVLTKITAIQRIRRQILTKNMRGGQNLPSLSSALVNVTWRRDLWGHRVIVFFRNVPNCWLKSYGKFGGATRIGFSLSAKNLRRGGADTPPAVRRLAVRGLN